MNFLSIMMGLVKAWDAMPDGERTMIVDVAEGLGTKFSEHRAKVAEQKAQAQAKAQERPPNQ